MDVIYPMNTVCKVKTDKTKSAAAQVQAFELLCSPDPLYRTFVRKSKKAENVSMNFSL